MQYYTDKLLEYSGLMYVVQQINQKLWRPIDILYQDGDPIKIMTELGWTSEYTIDKTLNDLLDYWVRKLGK